MGKVISSQAKKWAKHKKKLSSGRAAYWDYVELLIEIVDSASFLEEYANQAEFLKDEAGYTDRHFRALKVQCEVRQRIGDAVPENTLSLLSGKQLGEISKAPSEKQVEVYATASQAAEAEGRAIETDDLKKALKKVAPKTKTPKATSGDSPPNPVQNGAVESSEGHERQPGDESEEGGADPVKVPDWKKQRAKCLARANELQRDIDDLMAVRSSGNPRRHKSAIKATQDAIKLLEAWA